MFKIVKICIFAIILSFAAKYTLFACGDGCVCAVASASFDLVRSTITADTLVNLIKNEPGLKLIECRSETQESKMSIPNSKYILEHSDLMNIKEVVPATDTLIVLFPGIEGANIASMSQNLKSMGYISVLEYPDGVLGWMTYGYETVGE